ncbi:AMP-binding protein [Actinoplanes sp. Pm04-4]|uniref:AMP-binding protein n=1 Tax=Paractinoplanes pyxinae TaxID=2997416 RepID=A0ABT4BC49_9ACTN|nr:AMP-binding protein [Actinoplanes pyxinae]MCY1144096.1 AMP-binding protein [Actinoplanes pyxinae]
MDLLRRFTNCVNQYPDLVAVSHGDDSVTYAELDAWSRDVATRLRATVGQAHPRVGLWPVREISDYAGYLAILRAGGIVVPLNPAFPADRNQRICTQAGLRAVLTQDGAVPAALPSSIPAVAVHGPDPADGTVLPTPQVAPDDIAYILFTSGSTGTPKGVPISHRNVNAYLDQVLTTYDIGPGCRLSQTFDLTFDPSVFDIFAALGTGATAVLPRAGDLMNPVRYVTEQRLTHWFSVPSLVSVARRLSLLPARSMPDLRVSKFIGEQFTLAQAEAWAAAAPGSIIDNVYGPTEVTVACTGYRLPSDRADWPVTANGTVPIGESYREVEVTVQEDGELLLRGAQRFDGYADPADDSGRFVPDTAPITAEHWYRTGDRVARLDEGGFLHLGRLDHQVKLNGYRIELGEVEMALREDRRILDCVVLAVEEDAGLHQLHAVYSGSPVTPAEMIRGLRDRLPQYMIPRRFTRLPELPLTANGKIDRRALRDLLPALSRS